MEGSQQKGLIAYFANNPVAANLLMFFLIIIGLVSYSLLQRQMFPTKEINYINISAEYPGASPQEIEEGILIKLEESLKDVSGIKKQISTSERGFGHIEIEVDENEDTEDVLNLVKQKTDSVSNFPDGMEPLQVYQVPFRQSVIEMAVFGDRKLLDLKPEAKEVVDELLRLDNVSLVEMYAPDYEISIEVEPRDLQKYGLTLEDVRQAISRYSANYSAGEVRTEAGMISVRIENQFYTGEEFRDIPVKVGRNGGKVLLQDIAKIRDGFTEEDRYFKFSGKNAIWVAVKATKDQDMSDVAESVKAYIDKKNQELPSDVQIESVVDMTYYLNGRLDMVHKNILQAIVLVALMLGIFLRFKLAMWVMVGLPVCFLGTVMLMPLFGVTINIATLFGFIMVLGIVVDDAIVIGESACNEIDKHGGGVENVVRGAHRVATPATFGVLTTMAVFAPFLMSKGSESATFFGISVVVMLCLFFSLVESKLILPSHLAHSSFKPIKEGSWRDRFNRSFYNFVNGRYKRALRTCVYWRWSVLATFIGVLGVSIAVVVGNYIRMVPIPKIPHDFPSIKVTMNDNVSSQQTINALKSIEETVLKVEQKIKQETGQEMVRDSLAFTKGRKEGEILLPLVDEELRPIDTFELARRWREHLPVIPGLKSLTIVDNLNDDGKGDDFGFLLFGEDITKLNAAGRELVQALKQEKGLTDVFSSIDSGSREVLLSLTPVAYDLGLDLSMIAQQVGSSFYGGEAQRILRDGEETKVMVRYPKLTREAFSSLRYAIITTPEGRKVMLGDVVEINQQPGVTSIRREGGYRSVYVYGAIDDSMVEPAQVISKVSDEIIPQIIATYPGVKSELGGTIEEQQAQQNEQMIFFLAGMMVVYILLAIPLKSYSQPLIIMSIIPFSLTGAIWGHLLLGYDLSMMSTFGLIAAAGVVVNDSLVMTDYVNQVRARGVAIKDAVVEAGCARFRAITLTSITTFVGVLPIMFETSLQARFVIPMAVSLGFSVLFATLLTLVLVPCLYLILDDLKALVNRFKLTLIKQGKKLSPSRN